MKNHQRKIWLILSAFLIGCPCLLAQTTQKGIVLEMSSNHRPVAGVQLKVAGASPTDTDAEGRFTLTFSSSLPGDPLMIDDVYKKEYKIVNYEKIANWNISAASELKIVVGRAEIIHALRKKYYDIGESSMEREYRKTMTELEELKNQKQLSQTAYHQKMDSASRSLAEWRRRLEVYAAKFACINRDELDDREKQAMALLDGGDIQGAILLYEEMKLDSMLMLKAAGKQEAEEDIRLLLPSLINNFRLLQQANDEAACDSVAQLIYEMATEVDLKMIAVEWFFQRNDPEKGIDHYGLLVKEAKNQEEIEKVESSFRHSLKNLKPRGELKKKAQSVLERIEGRKKWMRIKEKM